LSKQVSPAAFGAILAVVLVIVALVGWKVFGKHQAVDQTTPEQIAAMKANSGGAGSAGHTPGGGSGMPTGSFGSMGMSGGNMSGGMSGGGMSGGGMSGGR